MAALLVFVVFLVAIAFSIPIGTSMILGSISPILLMHRGGSLVQLINNTFSGANSTPILAVPLFILGGVIMAKVESAASFLTSLPSLLEGSPVVFPVLLS